MIDPTLKQYLHETILPQYDKYDKGHNRDHILQVVAGAMELAQNYAVDTAMLYTAAIFHDLGLVAGRDTHHLTSAAMLRSDKVVASYFTPSQIETIAEAIEDHRASAKCPPRTLYGEILSSADRIIHTATIILRSYYYSLEHYPHYTLAQHLERIYDHMVAKYGAGGYLTLPILTAHNRAELQQLHTLLADRERSMERIEWEVAQIATKGENCVK